VTFFNSYLLSVRRVVAAAAVVAAFSGFAFAD
jgi:hypothetical protein